MPPPSCVVLCMKATQKDSATISKSVVEGFQRLKTFKTPPSFPQNERHDLWGEIMPIFE